ncbi:MAG: hypothetical protein U9Q06_04800 [Nanoarchaeota archaeon]|nr:hypothetical protein [Nanoarchaeota archaeon]
MVMRKKGQEGDMLKTIASIVLVVAFVGIIIYVILQFGSTAKGALVKFDVDELDLKYKACSTFYSPTFKNSFCRVNLGETDTVIIRNVNKKKIDAYVTCQYPELVKRLYDGGVIDANDLEGAVAEIGTYCGGALNVVTISECKRLRLEGFAEKVWINGIVFGEEGCDDITLNELGSAPAVADTSDDVESEGVGETEDDSEVSPGGN